MNEDAIVIAGNTLMDSAAAQKLSSFIQQIETLEEEKKTTSDAIKDVFQMAKMTGFDPKVMKTILKLRKKAADELEEEEILLDIYRKALGMTS